MTLFVCVFAWAQPMPEKIPLEEDPQPLPETVEPLEPLEPFPEAPPETLDPLESTVPLIRKNRESAPALYRQDRRLIQHPNAQKGLIRIEKDKTYIYRVQESEKKSAGS